MDVLFTNPHFWPHVHGGAEREVHDLGQRLAGMGHGVRLVTSQPNGVTSARRFGAMPVRYVQVPAARRTARSGRSHDRRFAAVAAAAAGLSSADLIHSFRYTDVAAVTRSVMVSRGRPVILKLTGTVPPERISKFPAEQRSLQAALERADEVWCNSRFAVAEMAAFDVPMRVMPAGIDIDRFHPSGTRSVRPTVLCTSTPDDPRKRVVDVIDAWPDVVAAVSDAQLLVTGSSDSSRDGFIARLPAPARASVVFTGILDDDTLLAAYRSAWVAVTPSVSEALGLSTLEALACGTPVVGADSGATSELVAEAGVGTLYGAADPRRCAQALVAWLDTPPSAVLSAWCVAAAAPYAWDAIVQTIVGRYDALLRR